MSLETLPDTTIDHNGYPTDAFLEWLKSEDNADIALREAADYFTDCGFGRVWCDPDGVLIRFATGGWSGCEDVIDALSQNLRVWGERWQQHHRGGLWVFEAGGVEVMKPEQLTAIRARAYAPTSELADAATLAADVRTLLAEIAMLQNSVQLLMKYACPSAVRLAAMEMETGEEL